MASLSCGVGFGLWSSPSEGPGRSSGTRASVNHEKKYPVLAGANTCCQVRILSLEEATEPGKCSGTQVGGALVVRCLVEVLRSVMG